MNSSCLVSQKSCSVFMFGSSFGLFGSFLYFRVFPGLVLFGQLFGAIVENLCKNLRKLGAKVCEVLEKNLAVFKKSWKSIKKCAKVEKFSNGFAHRFLVNFNLLNMRFSTLSTEPTITTTKLFNKGAASGQISF